MHSVHTALWFCNIPTRETCCIEVGHTRRAIPFLLLPYGPVVGVNVKELFCERFPGEVRIVVEKCCDGVVFDRVPSEHSRQVIPYR